VLALSGEAGLPALDAARPEVRTPSQQLAPLERQLLRQKLAIEKVGRSKKEHRSGNSGIQKQATLPTSAGPE